MTTVPTGAPSEEALREIADANARVQRAHESYTEAAETAKARKEKWQNLTEQLQTLITRLTAPGLPLFDAVPQEADLERMVTPPEVTDDPGMPIPGAPEAQEPRSPAGAEDGASGEGRPPEPPSEDELVF